MTDPTADDRSPTPLRLGFVRGVVPGKWARRWRASAPGHPLELVPLDRAFGLGPEEASSAADVLLERAAPGERPAGASGPDPARHALRLYTEAVALVVPAGHELADAGGVGVEELALVGLLDHPAHAAEWPRPEPWTDPAHAPADVGAALDLVAAGLGPILLPLPLARHLAVKREHVVVELTGDPAPPGTAIWATWAVGRDAADVQQLVGVMRGRTARSSRPAATGSSEDEARPPREATRPAKQKPALKPNSRGAQLAAARAKAERKQAERRAARRKRR